MDRVCPLLALAADHRTVVDGVDAAHRCHAIEPAAALDRERQSQVCLSTAHERCERYLAFLARVDRPRAGDPGIGDGLRSTRLVLTPTASWRGMAGRARRSTRGVAAIAAIGLVAVGGATAVAVGISNPTEVAVASPSPEPTATPAAATARPSASSRPSPTAAVASPSPVPPAPAPTPLPATPSPTAAPTTLRTYVVQAGDTLAAIAQRFGVEVSAIQAANGIADANQIIIGEVLVIP